jgi:hypothetical protein
MSFRRSGCVNDVTNMHSYVRRFDTFEATFVYEILNQK